MFEGLCILIIVGLVWYIYQPKQDEGVVDELRNENEFLRTRLNAHDVEHQTREENFTQTIKNLQSALDKQQNNVQSRSSALLFFSYSMKII